VRKGAWKDVRDSSWSLVVGVGTLETNRLDKKTIYPQKGMGLRRKAWLAVGEVMEVGFVAVIAVNIGKVEGEVSEERNGKAPR